MRITRCLGALAIALAGCAPLDPFDAPSESTPAPVTRGVWADLERDIRGDWTVPLNDGLTALEWRLRAIDEATSSIDLQTFIWSFDTVGTMLQDRLLAAAERGVRVRILVDDSFLAGKDRHLLELHRHENLDYRVYNPFKRRSNGSVSRYVLNLGEFDRLDHRMHNKAMVVDNQVAIVGGRNLADEYFGFDPDHNFRDMELLVGGPVVEEISASFDAYWNDRWSFPIDTISRIRLEPAAPGRPVDPARAPFPPEDPDQRAAHWRALGGDAFAGRTRLLVDNPPREAPQSASDLPIQVSQAFRELMDNARREIVIVSAYLIPTPALEGALRDAVGRGVRVRLLTNSINSNNHITAHAAYTGHIRQMLGFGAEVHEMRVEADSRPRYILSPVSDKKLGLHAKYMIIDGRKVVVGSSNLDPRSLRLNTEMALVVDSRPLARRLLALTEPDFDRSNAWELALDAQGDTVWLDEDGTVLTTEPAQSGFQRLEEWFFAHLPIEAEM